jgi:hypothetical protein
LKHNKSLPRLTVRAGLPETNMLIPEESHQDMLGWKSIDELDVGTLCREERSCNITSLMTLTEARMVLMHTVNDCANPRWSLSALASSADRYTV